VPLGFAQKKLNRGRAKHLIIGMGFGAQIWVRFGHADRARPQA
jgi:hypothetical protein